MAEATTPVPEKPDARERILDAAATLAAERGAANISVEAVALRAGLSKGGMLYHFRTKVELLSALVGRYIERTEAATVRTLAASSGGPNDLATALIGAYREERLTCAPPPTGLLAAIAAHPDLLDPLRTYHAGSLSKLSRESSDPDLATIAFLMIEGMKAMTLFGLEVMEPQQQEAALDRMTALLKGT